MIVVWLYGLPNNRTHLALVSFVIQVLMLDNFEQRRPAGATRLYFADLDGFRWRDNLGEFAVDVATQPVPEPPTLVLSGLGAEAHRRGRHITRSGSGGDS